MPSTRFLPLLVLSLLLPASLPAAETRPPTWPRVVVLPFTTPEGMEVLGRRLTRVLQLGLRGQLDVRVATPDALGRETAASCLKKVECVDRVLASQGAEAILSGEVEVDAESGAQDPQVLLAVTAPGWPYAYAERYAPAMDTGLLEVARGLLELSYDQTLPAPKPVAGTGTLDSGNDSSLIALAEAEEAKASARKKPAEGKEAEKAKGKKRGESSQDEEDEPVASRKKPAKEEESAPPKGKKKPAAESDQDEEPEDSLERQKEDALAEIERKKAEEIAKIEAEATERAQKAATKAAKEEQRRKDKAREKKLADREKSRDEADDEEEEAGEEDGEEDEDRDESRKARKAREKQAAREKARQAEDDEDSERRETRRKREEARAQTEPSRPQRPRKEWPARAPEGPWHGWTLSLGGSGAFGALSVLADSQVATDLQGEVTDQYSWAVRGTGGTYGGGLSIGRALGKHLELAVEGTVMPASREVQLYLAQAGQGVDSRAQRDTGLHALGGLRVRYFPVSGSSVQPYLGLSGGMWLSLGFPKLDEALGPHEQFDGYQRLAVMPALGTRVLLKGRLFLDLELQGLIDTEDVYLEKNLANTTGVIPVQDLVTPPQGGLAAGALKLSIGLAL